MNADSFLAAKFKGRTFKDVENIGQIKAIVFFVKKNAEKKLQI
jgi:hypothetical protein